MEDITRPTPILSYGMGVESTGILVRWILEPATRDFELSELIVVTAQTGQEFPDTKQCVERHLAPLLRAFGIRWVQIARAAQSMSDGFRVLSDTRAAEICYTGGQYRLGQELEAAGTVPEYAHGKRKCSIKSKGDPLDAWIAQELGEQPFRHFIGFNAEEVNRITRDLSYSSVERQSEYPLLDWAWTREETQEYLQSIFHIFWPKSCCSFCPFSGGRVDMLRRYRIFPREAAEAVMLEYVSMALNPRMSLYSGRSLLSSIRADGNARVLDLFEEMLNADVWAVYRVRRVYFHNSCWRKTEIVSGGSREEVSAAIYLFGDGELNTATDHLRVTVREKEQGKDFPREEFFVACPARAMEKSRPSFDEKWAQVDESEKQLRLQLI
jgi:hypothetical protein